MDIIWALAFSSHLGMQGDYNEVHPHVRVVDRRLRPLRCDGARSPAPRW